MPTSSTFAFVDCDKSSTTQRFSFIRHQYKEEVIIKSMNYANVYWKYSDSDVFYLMQRNNEGDFLISSTKTLTCLTYNTSTMSISQLFSSNCSLRTQITNQYFQLVKGYENDTYEISGSYFLTSGETNYNYISKIFFYLNESDMNNPNNKNFVSLDTSTHTYNINLPKGSYKYNAEYSSSNKCKYKASSAVISVGSCDV